MKLCTFSLYELSFNGVDCNPVEIMNLRNLERVLAREEEVKKRAIVHKAVYSGPQIQYLSKDGKHSLTCFSFESLLENWSLTLECTSLLILKPFYVYLWISFSGYTYLEFSKGASFHSEISTTSVPCKFTISKVVVMWKCVTFNVSCRAYNLPMTPFPSFYSVLSQISVTWPSEVTINILNFGWINDSSQ